MSGYELYYWPNIQGRGEFVRLALEASGTPYRDVVREEGVAAMVARMEGERPPFAPPFLVHGDVVLAQAAAILMYLGPRIGLVPEDEAGRLWCHQLQLTVMDFVKEIHDTHHPLGAQLYYEEQVPEARRRAAGFVTDRLPKYLGWLERVAVRNEAGTWLVGPALTVADLSVFQVLEGLHYAFPRAMAERAGQYARLERVRRAVAEVPLVAAYLASERRIAFNEHGVFRWYAELDVPG